MHKIAGGKSYYRPDELAAELGVSLRNVYHWIHVSAIRHIHVGKTIRIPASEMDRIRREGICRSL
jgi:excisionase family DNA binding protein